MELLQHYLKISSWKSSAWVCAILSARSLWISKAASWKSSAWVFAILPARSSWNNIADHSTKKHFEETGSIPGGRQIVAGDAAAIGFVWCPWPHTSDESDESDAFAKRHALIRWNWTLKWKSYLWLQCNGKLENFNKNAVFFASHLIRRLRCWQICRETNWNLWKLAIFKWKQKAFERKTSVDTRVHDWANEKSYSQPPDELR